MPLGLLTRQWMNVHGLLKSASWCIPLLRASQRASAPFVWHHAGGVFVDASTLEQPFNSSLSMPAN